MSAEPVAPKPSRTPWIIAGVLGCLVVCLLVAVLGVAGYFFLGISTVAVVSTPTRFAIPVQSPSSTVVRPTAVIATVQPIPPTLVPVVQTPVPVQSTATAIQPTVTITRPTTAPAQPTATRPTGPTGKILFSRSEGDLPENKSIWIMNADGSNPKKILDKASHPAFSPDGTKVVYYHWTDGLWVANVDGTNQKKIVGDTFTGGDYGSPDWSHDGRFIAFSAQPGGKGNIYVDAVAQDGTGRHSLVTGEAPSWSPDDTMLVFHTCRDNTGCGIFKASSAGGQEAVPVVTDDGGLPSFSPNGKLILYQKDADGAKQLFLINADGSGKKQLTSGASMHVSANWSTDGNFIFYRSPESGSWAIWVMNADGTNPRKLIDNVTPVNWPYERLAVAK